MGWSYGFVDGRDVGYGVPAECDNPTCSEKIDRGTSYKCEGGCGLFFCGTHLRFNHTTEHLTCVRCLYGSAPFERKPDIAEWLNWKMTDESWQRWRDENTDEVSQVMAQLAAAIPSDLPGSAIGSEES